MNPYKKVRQKAVADFYFTSQFFQVVFHIAKRLPENHTGLSSALWTSEILYHFCQINLSGNASILTGTKGQQSRSNLRAGYTGRRYMQSHTAAPLHRYTTLGQCYATAILKFLIIFQQMANVFILHWTLQIRQPVLFNHYRKSATFTESLWLVNCHLMEVSLVVSLFFIFLLSLSSSKRH